MFPSTDAALRWGFLVASVPVVKLSSINKMCCKPGPSTTNTLLIGLSQQDALAQAQSIVGATLNLHDPAYTQYVYARYSGVLDTKRTGTIMIRLFAELGTGATRRRGIWKIVLRYFGRKINQSEIRDALQCDRNKVPATINKVYTALDNIHEHSMAEMDDILKEKGIVE